MSNGKQYIGSQEHWEDSVNADYDQREQQAKEQKDDRVQPDDRPEQRLESDCGNYPTEPSNIKTDGKAAANDIVRILLDSEFGGTESDGSKSKAGHINRTQYHNVADKIISQFTSNQPQAEEGKDMIEFKLRFNEIFDGPIEFGNDTKLEWIFSYFNKKNVQESK
jgi:hypothetical protein